MAAEHLGRPKNRRNQECHLTTNPDAFQGYKFRTQGVVLIVYQEELVVVCSFTRADDLRLTEHLLPQQSLSPNTRSHTT